MGSVGFQRHQPEQTLLYQIVERTYNPTTAIWIDHKHGAMHGAASDYGDDYGIAW